MKTNEVLVSDRYAKRISKTLAQNKPLNLSIPGLGKLFIDRTLPFLLLGKLHSDYRDMVISRLVKSESSFFLFHDEPESLEVTKSLLFNSCNSILQYETDLVVLFLSISNDINGEELPIPPEFLIYNTKSTTTEPIAQNLAHELSAYRFYGLSSSVKIIRRTNELFPVDQDLLEVLKPLKEQIHFIHLSIGSFLLEQQTGNPLPIPLLRFHRFLSRSIRRSLFSYVKETASERILNFSALGRRSFVKSVQKVDREIADINLQFNMLFLLTPYNVDEEYETFRAKKFEREPKFLYKPLYFDPSALKRRLFSIRLQEIEDPVLYELFTQKQQELDRQISLLQDRLSSRLLYSSLQLFGKPSNDLIKLAQWILENVPRTKLNDKQKTYLGAREIREQAEKQILEYQAFYPELTAEVIISDDVSGILVSKGNLYIGEQTRINAQRIESLLNHEIGTHIVTFYNGKAQPFKLLESGFAGYEELQEGIAVFSELLTGGLTAQRFRLLAARVIAARNKIEGASFLECFNQLNYDFGFSSSVAYLITMRIFRGGGYIKDFIYLKGFFRLLHYLSKNKIWKPLFYGKISFEQIPLIKELEARQILKKIPLIPNYMSYWDNLSPLIFDSELSDLERLKILKQVYFEE